MSSNIDNQDPMSSLKEMNNKHVRILDSNENDGFIIHPENLSVYIKKSNKRVGVIRANKIELTPSGKNIVFIAHSKAHSIMDKFDKSMMEHILINRYKHMYDTFYDHKKVRVKNQNSCPPHLEKLYRNMRDRSMNYFKDCSEIYMYINTFDYFIPE